ncbi:MAG: tRNA (guanine(26)-N(2))-dimethyltransferase [Candidatus Methanomethylophilaceae archaeon]
MLNGIQIQEGLTKLIVPVDHSVNGPGRINDSIFFNEQMAFNRDVSVMFLRALGKKITVADAMSATGSRAVRIAKEVPNSIVTANDINSDAIPYIEANIELNELTNCTSSRKNLHSLLAENVFDYIDIDPFGSPMPFLHSAIQGCKRYGILAITATDTAPLAGAHRAKCERRYQSRPIRGPMCHEGGLRILLATMAREMAKFDKGMTPVLSFYADHYFRVYIHIEDGAGNADDSLSKLVYLSYNPETLERSISKEMDKDHKYGPFWGGQLFDKEHLSKMDPTNTAKEKRCIKMLDLWKHEIDDIPYLYDMSEISSYLKISTPRYETFLEKMNECGKTSATHMGPTLFKTELELKEILSIFKEHSPM